MNIDMRPILRILCLLTLLFVPHLALAQDDGKESSNKVDTEVKELSGISIIGNKEAPKSLYIVPWKSAEVGVESGLSSSLMDSSLQPLDKEVFIRELEFYELSQADD